MINLHELPDPQDFPLTECDICIVGTGPAGSTIARELSGTETRVVVLESGSTTRLSRSDALDEIDDIGRPRATQWSVRNRILGGSSHTWGGRCAPFDEIDYEVRPWVPHSGWPLKPDILGEYLDRSAKHLGLARGRDFSDEGFWHLLGRDFRWPEPDREKLLSFFWQFSRDSDESYPFEYMRFGRHLERALGSNVSLVCGATAVEIDVCEAGDAVRGIRFAGPDGRRFDLKSSAIVLCAGGIENARLLLLSDKQAPEGLGNRHDLVGRYLMDHLRGPVGFFDVTKTRSLQKRLGRWIIDDRLFRGGFRLSPRVQREQHLLNCAVWLGETLAPDDPVDALRRILSRDYRMEDAKTLLANLPLLARGAKDYFIDRNGFPRKVSELSLECMVEQRPDPDSRVTLSDQRDLFGNRLPRVDWRSHADEARTMHEAARIVAAEFERLGIPAPVLADWVRERGPIPSDFVDVAHPTGTTRMSDDPTTGVVDAQCQVHGVRGLYIAGSSVFPTAGHCNPTQMIVALAVRVADRLKATGSPHPATAGRRAAPERSDRSRVLLTGATGRIGRVLLKDLLDQGYRVRATTSKPVSGHDGEDADVQWTTFDFLQDHDYDGLVEDCDVVVHLAAEIGKMERMRAVNAEATANLARAAEARGVGVFCYMSTVSVYGSSRRRVLTETGPLLTAESDVKSEYWALDYVREYGRTKLAGEHAIERIAKTVPFVVFRPSVVVDLDSIVGIRDWSVSKRLFAAHRHAHHVFVRDVTHAVVWAIEKAREGKWAPGSVHTFNLTEDEAPGARHIDFMRRAYDVSRDRRYRVPPIPGVIDWLRDALRFRASELRNPLWRMRFSNDRLKAAGFRFRVGMQSANQMALDALRRERTPARSIPSSEDKLSSHV